MPLDFPTSPSINDVITEGNRSWKWNGRYWQATSVTVGYTGSQGVDGAAVDKGYTGSIGNLGYSGSVGYVGSQGVDGAAVDKGYTGSASTTPGYTGSAGEVSLSGGQTLSNKTLQNTTLTGKITEQVYNLTGTDINPTNGTIQYKTVTSNTSFTVTMDNGTTLTLQLKDADAYVITWPEITWVSATGNVTPILSSNTFLVFWKFAGTIYASMTGSAH